MLVDIKVAEFLLYSLGSLDLENEKSDSTDGTTAVYAIVFLSVVRYWVWANARTR